MPVSTVSAAVHITPVVVKTFAKHSKRLAKKQRDKRPDEAQDDIFFDQAFHIVKAFIELGTKNTVESLQKFTNTHVPAPYWAAVAACSISLATCNQAADGLVDWFGPEELKSVVGGERWWQVRGLDGADAEWITQKEFLDDDEEVRNPLSRKLTEDEETTVRMEKLDRVMLYVHGGGYFWGSINTHRYQLIRYARKIHGRVFAVNYRKAPQYPWPCPVQDVLAAYLYLIQPPPDAVHQPVSPSKIVLAGDSAGAGLCVTVLTLIRDMGLPMAAGAILISPWVDLTHSFPSVMENTETDIIPQHGFLAKPSTTWPVDSLPGNDGRVGPSKHNDPPEPGHADQLRPTKARLEGEDEDEKGGEGDHTHVDPDDYDVDYWEPRPPKVQMKDPNAESLELHSQIQLYATTEQLSHPLVSPVLQGSLGNLCPLYIIAGNSEVLRDEIVYLAHRAAYPDKFPTRRGALRDAHRQEVNAKLYTEPTKVHLQIFDDMCHVLTVFTFTESAKHAYRSISAFVKHVVDHSSEQLAEQPFPDLNRQNSHDTFETAVTDDKSEKQAEETRQVHMLRERVDIHGKPRPMESMEDMPVLKLKPAEIGIIKEEPCLRWLHGQEEWDKTYKRQAERAMRQRQRYREKAEKMISNAREQGLKIVSDDPGRTTRTSSSVSDHRTDGVIQTDRRWGPLDLDDENPPPTAIAKRRDTPEAIALLKKHIYHTAPATHRVIPKLKLSDAVKASLDPNDDPNKPPKQSVSEAQVRNSLVPDSMHGLRIWDVLVGYFMRKSTEKAANGKNAIKKAIKP